MNDAVKEEIRERLPVEDVVGQYIDLKRAGRNLKGHSPWGTDRTPSFMVSPEKGIWHDFSSNKGGDIFSFVMEMEGLSFREALEKLAKQAGVELKKYSGDDKAVAEKKKRLYEALELATKYYQTCLVRNQTVCRYVFYQRHLNRKTVEEFRIGYAPQKGNVLVNFLKKRGFTARELEDAGLVNRFGGDLFKGRMMVPLMDQGGRVIGFTGRIVDDKLKDTPKYLNTPETILYNKGRHIFGLSQAREAIRRSDFVVVVEGNMDVISSHQAGVREAVATAGTAMTENHLKAFSRMTNDIRLAYDGDEAGVKAGERAIAMSAKFGIYLSVIDNYHGCKDADELIQKSAELWRKAVQDYRPALEWILEKYEEQYDLKTEKGFQEYASEAKRLIDGIDKHDTALREKYERLVSKRLGISLEAFRAKQVKSAPKRLKKMNVVKNTTSVISRAEKHLSALAQYGKISDELVELARDDLDKAELSLIYDEQYVGWTVAEQEREAGVLAQKVRSERLSQARKELEEQIRLAEENHDEELENRLAEQMNELLRQK